MCVSGGSKPPPYGFYHGVPKKAEAFLGRGDITKCVRGEFLLKIRHKQYGVNVDDVGPDALIGPQSLSHCVTVPFAKEPKIL